MCPSALPVINKRWPLITVTIGIDCVFRSWIVPPGVDIHWTSPVRLSKA